MACLRKFDVCRRCCLDFYAENKEERADFASVMSSHSPMRIAWEIAQGFWGVDGAIWYLCKLCYTTHVFEERELWANNTPPLGIVFHGRCAEIKYHPTRCQYTVRAYDAAEPTQPVPTNCEYLMQHLIGDSDA